MINSKNNGVDEIKKNIEKALLDILQKSAENVDDFVHEIAEDSCVEAPKDTGAMRESMKGVVNDKIILTGLENGKVATTGKTKVNKKTEKIEGIIYYDTPYCVVQHEDITLNHPTTGTKAKYLQDPFQKKANDFAKRFENLI